MLLLSKEALQRRVLADKGLDIYQCGREDIASGKIDRRVLAVLEYLRVKGFRLTVTALECGHGYFTTSGNVSEHSSGDAVDIAAINGVPVLGHQGPGTPTDKLIHDVLQLQGTMHPHQVISLENLPGPTSFALADHADHVHIGYRPAGANPFEVEASPLLKPEQWQRLIQRLGEIKNPDVPIKPSKYSEPDSQRERSILFGRQVGAGAGLRENPGPGAAIRIHPARLRRAAAARRRPLPGARRRRERAGRRDARHGAGTARGAGAGRVRPRPAPAPPACRWRG